MRQETLVAILYTTSHSTLCAITATMLSWWQLHCHKQCAITPYVSQFSSSESHWRQLVTTSSDADEHLLQLYSLLANNDHRHTGQFSGGGLSHLCPKNFSWQRPKNCTPNLQITLPNSHHPVIISKNPGFRALYLARRNEFRFFSFNKYKI